MPYLIFDLEMTGSEAGYHDIIQIGAVLADDDWKVLSQFESLVYPDNEETMSTAAEEIHGISIYDLEDAPSSLDALEDFEAWVRKSLHRRPQDSLKDITLCGQSVINDINFLKQKYDELHLAWPFSYRLIDLMSISFLMYRIWDTNKVSRPKSYSLKAVADYFSLQREDDQHNALEDAQLTYACFKKYFETAGKLRIDD